MRESVGERLCQPTVRFDKSQLRIRHYSGLDRCAIEYGIIQLFIHTHKYNN